MSTNMLSTIINTVASKFSIFEKCDQVRLSRIIVAANHFAIS